MKIENLSLGIAQNAEYKLIAHGAISVRPGQPRKHFDDAKLAELAESIKSVGMIEPLLVRPISQKETKETKKPSSLPSLASVEFELVCGERRWRAAHIAGLKEVPCLVRELTDLQALEIQGIENLQREDLSPLEEAGWMQQLLDAKAYTVQTLGEKIGKKRSAIFARLRLLKLSPALKKALEEGSIDATKAGLISSIVNPSDQGKALGKAIKGDWGTGPMSTRQLQEHIAHEYQADLKKAPFDRQVKLAGVLPCISCPKRSGNMADEFPELAAHPDICTDLACWEKKKQAHASAVLEKARQEGRPTMSAKEFEAIRHRDSHAILDETNYRDTNNRTYSACLKEKLKGKSKEVAEQIWKETIVAIDDDGAVHEVVPAKALEKAKISLRPKAEPSSYDKQHRARVEKRKAREKVGKVAMLRVLVAARTGPTDAAFLRLLCRPTEDTLHGSYADTNAFIAKAKEDELRAMLIEQTYGERAVNYNGDWEEEFERACKHYGVDLAALEKEAAKPPQKATKATKPKATAKNAENTKKKKK